MNSTSDIKVLILEDEEINRMMLRKILEKNGCQVYAAATGKEALDFTRENPIDAAFIDINLDNENGIEILSTLRKEFEFQGPAFTASGDLEAPATDSFTNELISGHIRKPYDRDLIAKIITDIRTKKMS